MVIDGVTVGHPCCGEPNCKVPLANNHDHFCLTHARLNQICAVVHCLLQVVPGKRTCALADHKAIENVHNDCGQARFQLKERLCRAQLAHPLLMCQMSLGWLRTTMLKKFLVSMERVSPFLLKNIQHARSFVPSLVTNELTMSN